MERSSMTVARALNVLVLTVLSALTGCAGSGGDEGFEVKGRLTQDGQPIQVSDQGTLALNFYEVTDAGKVGMNSYPGHTTKDGTFTATLPAGKYQVAVEQLDPDKDKLGGKFSGSNSPVTVQISGPEESLEIDLSAAKK